MDVSGVVPGDLVQLDEGTVPADMVLITGECTMKENQLTGKRVQIVKKALSDQEGYFSLRDHSQHLVYLGTTLLEKKSNPVGLVLRTGFYS